MAKKVEFRWFLAMGHATIFDSNCRKKVLFDKQISKFAFGDDFDLFSLIIEKDDRIFKLTSEFSKVGGVI